MVISAVHLSVFFLVFARIGGMFQTAPVFSRKDIFGVAKIAIVFWMSALILFVVPLPAHIPDKPLLFVVALIIEFLLGATIGYVAQLMFAAVAFAGSLMDTQAGLSVASILDPASGHSTTLIELILKWMVLIIFLVINGHHMLLSAVYQSFKLFPVGGMNVNFPNAAEYLASLGGSVFLTAAKLAAPIMLIVFLVDFVFGMLARVAPQVNVFQLGFQVKPSIALIIFFAVSPGLVAIIGALMQTTAEQTFRVMFLLKP